MSDEFERDFRDYAVGSSSSEENKGDIFSDPQALTDLYFLAQTAVSGDDTRHKGLHEALRSGNREDVLQSYVADIVRGGPIEFIRLVEGTVERNTALRRDGGESAALREQWNSWRNRVYQTYQPILFPGPVGMAGSVQLH